MKSSSRSHLLRRYARRVAGGLAFFRFGPQLRSDWRNLRDLFFQPAAARAECPICGYRGVFLDHAGRRRQVCPGCGSRARHRALHLALGDYARRHALPRFERALHFAPEACLRGTVAGLADRIVTADLEPRGVDLSLDICRLPFRDGAFGLVIASHVLEHVVDDRSALAEIRRVLAPGGLALLLVPVTVEKTIEYGAADPLRNDHVRECGPDYFDRYGEAGFRVELLRSDRLPGADRNALLTLEGGSSLPHFLPFCRR